MTRQLKKEQVPAYDLLQLNEHANFLWVGCEGDVAKCKKLARNTIRPDLIDLIDGMIDNMAAGN